MEELKTEKKNNKKKGKKKHVKGEPRRILWVLGCAVLLAVCVLAAVRLNWEEAMEEAPSQPDTRGSLVNRNADEIRRVTVRLRGQEPWSAARDEDGRLRMEGEENWELNTTLGQRIENALANVVYEAVLTEDPAEYKDRLAEFGLDDPLVTASAEYTDGASITLHIGNASGLEDADYRYMTVEGDPRLFAAAGSFLEDLQFESALLRPVEQPEIQTARLDRITVMDGEENILKEWSLMGSITDQDADDSWYLKIPAVYPADCETMNNLKKNAGSLRLGIWVADADKSALSEYGLETPERILELHMAAGTTGQTGEDGVYDIRDWPEETLRFEIGKAKNELTDYVLFGGAVYTVNRFTLETLTEARPEETLARYLITVPLDSLKQITVTDTSEAGAKEITVYELERDSEGNTACRKNGQAISWSAFEAAYERLLVVTVSGKLPEGWEKRETFKTIELRTLSGKTHTLELSPYDALHDAVTVDGGTMFYLYREGLTPLP